MDSLLVFWYDPAKSSKKSGRNSSRQVSLDEQRERVSDTLATRLTWTLEALNNKEEEEVAQDKPKTCLLLVTDFYIGRLKKIKYNEI